MIAAEEAPLEAPGEKARIDWSPYGVFALGFLTLISSLNYLDRSILGLALPRIKAEMQVSDFVLGLVSGLVFSALYTLMGVPIAWLADRWNRRNIIAIGLFFWSVMTLMTGFVSNVAQLALCRMLMGAGEAASLPPSNSIVSDLFSKAKRPLALSILGTASSIASLLYLPIIARVGDAHGWRAMFMAAGIPGAVLAVLFMLLIREPQRTRSGASGRPPAAAPFLASLGFVMGSRAYVLMLIGATFMGANIWAAGAWSPTFLARVHHMTMTQVADALGPTRGVLGLVGILGGGVVINRLGRRDARWRLRIPAIACLLVGPSEFLFLMGASTPVWLSGFAGTTLLSLVHQPPAFAAAMNVARQRMRALSVAVMLLFATLFGQVIGPAMVGLLTDILTPAYGAMAIRYSMLLIAVTPMLSGACFWAASRFLEADTARAEEADRARA